MRYTVISLPTRTKGRIESGSYNNIMDAFEFAYMSAEESDNMVVDNKGRIIARFYRDPDYTRN
jgi:hypothetical protein